MKKLISWVEIPATNFERAINFYSSVLQIKMKVLDCGKEKMACFPSGEGAISMAPGFKPSTDGVLVSFNTENWDKEQVVTVTGVDDHIKDEDKMY